MLASSKPKLNTARAARSTGWTERNATPLAWRRSMGLLALRVLQQACLHLSMRARSHRMAAQYPATVDNLTGRSAQRQLVATFQHDACRDSMQLATHMSLSRAFRYDGK